MELLALLLPLGLLLAIGIGGGGGDDDDGGTEVPPENDIIEGDAGDNQIDGGAGDDLIFGAQGNDEIEGGETSEGDSGFDILAGEGGHDTLGGGDESDLLLGGSGNDLLSGGTGNDALLGGAGNDSLIGDDGDDDMFGISGQDTLDGGEGSDLLVGLDPRGPLSVQDLVEPFSEIVGSVLSSRYGEAVATENLDRVARSLLSSDGSTFSDVLDGGSGDDFIVGDLGDQMKGGEGTDDFRVYMTEEFSEPVVISDFDATTEYVTLFTEGFSPGEVAVTDGPLGAVITLGGNPVAVLYDVLAANIPNGSITLQAS